MPHGIYPTTTTTDRKERIRKRLDDAKDRMLARRALKSSRRVNFSIVADPSVRSRVDDWSIAEHGCTFPALIKEMYEEGAKAIRPRKYPRVSEDYLSSLSPLDLFLARFHEDDRDWAELVFAMAKRMQPGEFLSTGDMCDECEYPMDSVLRSRSSLQGIGRVMKLMKPRWIRMQIVRDGKRIWAYKKPVGMYFPEGYK
jgi:hypothetical protein